MDNYNFSESKKFEIMTYMTAQNIEIPEHRHKYIIECDYYYREMKGKIDKEVLNNILEKFKAGNKNVIKS